MAFASSQTLREAYGDLIDPFEPENIKHGSYELTVGREVVSTGAGLARIEPGDFYSGWPLGAHVDILPGQLAMLITAETVTVPDNKLALISIRAGKKLEGLINVSGFHVDPGFRGRIKFTVYNAGSKSVTVRRGEGLFMIWFADFDHPVDDPYRGDHQGQMQIGDKDIRKLKGRLPSPIDLDQRMSRVEDRLKWLLIIAAAIAAVAFTGRIPGCANQIPGEPGSAAMSHPGG